VTLACDWPNIEMGLTTATIEADAIRDAARRVRDRWRTGSQRGRDTAGLSPFRPQAADFRFGERLIRSSSPIRRVDACPVARPSSKGKC